MRTTPITVTRDDRDLALLLEIARCGAFETMDDAVKDALYRAARHYGIDVRPEAFAIGRRRRKGGA